MTTTADNAASTFATRARSLAPGVALALAVAAAAFVSDHYGAPVMLIALLIGMAFNTLGDAPVS